MKTIKTPTHLLWVDETAEIIPCNPVDVCMAHKTKPCDECGKYQGLPIIAASPKLEGIPEFETLPEDDVEKLAEIWINDRVANGNEKTIATYRNGFMDGYTQAKSEIMFSLDDMKSCWQQGIKSYVGKEGTIFFEEFIQSLTKPKYEFVPEMLLQVRHGVEWHDLPNQQSGNDKEGIYRRIPKIINNKIQGRWVLS